MEDQPKKNNKLENEAEIVERAKTDEQAFGILYNHYFPQIYGYIFKRCGNHENTEDLVAEIFMKAFSKLDKYDYQGYSFSSWLYRVATNTLIDFYRKSGRRQEVNIDDLAEPKSENKSPEELAELAQNREAVMKAMTNLSERHQKIINLKYFAQMDNDEIAEIMGITSNNARVLIFRALKKFEKIYVKMYQ